MKRKFFLYVSKKEIRIKTYNQNDYGVEVLSKSVIKWSVLSNSCLLCWYFLLRHVIYKWKNENKSNCSNDFNKDNINSFL